MKKQCPVCKRTFKVKRSKRHRVHCSQTCRYEPTPPEPTWQLNGATIYWSECLAILKQLPSNTVDSIVTDPPAGIGFLQKAWDNNKGGRDSWIKWMAEIASECLRVIKPGGHALVWALPRTSHWTATAWEDAGWELRDRISHLYGCLSSDTEILVDGEWRQFTPNIKGRHTLAYNNVTETFQWEEIQETFEYAYHDTAFRISSDKTDQIVSQNHRCLVERSGGEVFQEAETLECEESVPILEDLHDLLEALPVPYKGVSNAKQNMLTGVRLPENLKRQERKRQRADRSIMDDHTLPMVRQACQNKKMRTKVSPDSALQPVMPSEACDSANVSGEQIRSNWKDIPRHRVDGRCEPSLEGRGDLLSETRELQTNQICPMPGRISTNGPQGWVHDGTSSSCCTGDRSVSVADRSGASLESQPSVQPDREPSTFRQQSSSQTVRASRYTRTTLARVKPFYYEGTVWCVKVPSGAFVARRNGKVFITGNSGFPKGVNIPKAIDKALGVEPTIIGSKGKTGTRKNRIEDLGYQTTGGKSSVFTNEGVELFETEPTSEAAKEWHGWHNTLKPAIEDWHLFRKPLDGTLVTNVLLWGTGGLNIGACRVKRGDADLTAGQRTVRPDSLHHDPEKTAKRKTLTTPMAKYSKEGGFPAHLILSDAEEYEEFFPHTKTSKGKRGKLLSGQHGGLDGKEPNQKEGTDTVRGHTDEGSATRYFPQMPRICYCPKASGKDKNEGCEVLDLKLKWPGKTSQSQSFAMLANQQRKARNIHPTVKPTPLMRWLVKLVTRPGGVVLDPFAGSGSTGKAAALEGCRFIGIEADGEYVPILIARINHALTS